MVNPRAWNNQDVAEQLSTYHSYSCERSQYAGITFMTKPSGRVYRMADSEGVNHQLSPLSVSSSFFTQIGLWESISDTSSKDSIVFSVDKTTIAFAVSNGTLKDYSTNINPAQPAAIVVADSIEVYSGDQKLVVSSTDSTVLEGVNNGSEGTITYLEDGSIDISVSFENAPPENSHVYVRFDQRFKANDILILESKNLDDGSKGHVIEHRLEQNLNPGDQIKVQDPVQSILASTGGANSSEGLRLYRNLLNLESIPVAMNIPGVSGSVSCVEFTSDGDGLFVGTMNGQVYRITGLQNLYTADDFNQISVTTLNWASVGAGGITGLALDPNDDNRLVVTAGGYGGSDRVKISTNALGAATFSNIHSNLARMPIYDAVIDRNNPDIIVLGTEFGIWATSNASDAIPTWSDENSDNTYVPVYSVRQQSLPWEMAKNTGMYYFGAYGRGFWKSSSLVGLEDVDPLAENKDAAAV